MFPARCKLVQATSLEHAATLLSEFGHDTRVIAGGQSLIPLMKYRLAQPEILVDISSIPPDPIQLTESTAEIHSLTTHATIEHHGELTSYFDVIADGVPQIADPQVRNLGTIGGGLAQADPSNDWGPIVLTAGGTISTISPTGTNEYSPRDFFYSPFTTALDHDELITSVSLPLPEQPTGGAYLKATRRHGVYGIATAGAQVTLDEDGICQSFGFCCTDDVSTYVAPHECTTLLEGSTLDNNIVTDAATIVKREVNPANDSRGSREYKRSLSGELFSRAVRVAKARATGTTISDPMNPL